MHARAERTGDTFSHSTRFEFNSCSLLRAASSCDNSVGIEQAQPGHGVAEQLARDAGAILCWRSRRWRSLNGADALLELLLDACSAFKCTHRQSLEMSLAYMCLWHGRKRKGVGSRGETRECARDAFGERDSPPEIGGTDQALSLRMRCKGLMNHRKFG